MPGVVREGKNLPISLRSLSSGDTYEGPIIVMAVSVSTNHSQPVSELTSGVTVLHVQLNRDQADMAEKKLSLMALNEVSNATLNLTVIIAGKSLPSLSLSSLSLFPHPPSL